MEKTDSEILYSMKLHDTYEVKTQGLTYVVTRVIGGWLYNHIRLDCDQMNMVFVPWNNEMQP
jgi:hypothetical protein